MTPIVVDVLAITSPLAIFASRLLSTREKASSTFALCRKNCSKTDLSTASRRALREAVTVAARWPPSSSDISPKNSPGPSRLTIRLGAPPQTSSSPLTQTKKVSPSSPSAQTVSPRR